MPPDTTDWAAEVLCNNSQGPQWCEHTEAMRDVYRRRIRTLLATGALVSPTALQHSHAETLRWAEIAGHRASEITALQNQLDALRRKSPNARVVPRERNHDHPGGQADRRP